MGLIVLWVVLVVFRLRDLFWRLVNFVLFGFGFCWVGCNCWWLSGFDLAYCDLGAKDFDLVLLD